MAKEAIKCYRVGDLAVKNLHQQVARITDIILVGPIIQILW